MKRKILFIAVTSLMTCLNINAQTVSEGDARAKALEFFSNGAKKLPAKNGAKRQAPAVGNVKLAYTSQKEDKTCFYVFNNGTDGGFVIIGGDEAAKEILAYVPQGHFDYDKAPDNLKWWLSKYENANSVPRKTTENGNYHDIPELIKTKWNQGTPFNCKVKEQGGEDYPTGCAATAVAQIMKFWNYPEQGQGSHTDELFPSFSADFGSTTYDWDNMLDSYNEEYNKYNKAQVEAVGTLMYHVGVALDILYTTDRGSIKFTIIDGNTEVHNGLDALVKHFNYDKGLTSICRFFYSLEEWKNLLYDELLSGRPIYYEGSVTSGEGYVGHAFICNGYSADLDMFAFNWGWGGLDDGYFSIAETDHFLQSSINTGKDTECITIGIQPQGYTTLSGVCYGEKFTIGNLTYMVNSPSQHTASVVKLEDDAESIIIPNTVQYKGEDYTITRIDNFAFSGQSTLKHVEFPNTLLTIGSGAFYGSDLENVKANDGLKIISGYAFQACRELTNINLPSSLEIIGVGAFYDCIKLKNVSFPSSLKKIDTQAFAWCTSLDNVIIPSSIKEIDQGVFEHCINLENLQIENGVQDIWPYAFKNCESLTKIIFPQSVKHLYKDSFKDCPNLTEVYSYSNKIYNYSDYFETFHPYRFVLNVDNGSPFTLNKSNISLYVLAENLSNYEGYSVWEGLGAIKPIVPVESIQLEDISIERTYSKALNVNFVPVNATKGQILYSSSNQSIVTVSSDGVLTAIGEGIATITAKTMDGIIATCTVTVTPSFVGTKFEQNGFQYEIIPYGAMITSYSGNGNNIDLIIPESVEYKNVTYPVIKIGFMAFYNNLNLKSLTIGSNITSIERSAFNCRNLTGITVNAGNTYYDSRDNCNAIIESATNTLLYGCNRTVIPNTVTNIGNGAFLDVEGLTTINIPESVTSIGDAAFYLCRDLTSVTIGSNVSSIGDDAFKQCRNLTIITVNAGNTYYDSRDNCNAIIESATNTLLYGSQRTVIPKTITSIGDDAFYDVESLTTISIPESVTSIGNAAFFYCIGLTSVTIGSNVSSIGNYAFSGCDKLNSVTNFSTTPQEIDYSVFSNYGTLHVLPGCGEAYRNAENWKNFTIVEDAGTNIGDVNGDGKVDVIDINAIVNVILDNTSAGNKDGLTDVNGDGKTDVIDINALINIILGQ